jgi:hypothetical protein
MLRIQRSETYDQALTNRVYISNENKRIPEDTQYVVINRQWVFALARTRDCPLNAILTNVIIRKLDSALKLDKHVTVEPLESVRLVQSSHRQEPGNQTRYLAVYRMDNPEVGPPSLFRKLAVEVLNSLGMVSITEMNESSIEFTVAELQTETITQRFQDNYNNVRYYIGRLVKLDDNKTNVNYLNYLIEENRVPALAKLVIEIPLLDKVAGTFADMDYGECVCHVIQPNLPRLYEYIKHYMLNTVIYEDMSLAVDPQICFIQKTRVSMLFRVRSVQAPTTAGIDTFDGHCQQTNSPFGILTPETVIEFVN